MTLGLGVLGYRAILDIAYARLVAGPFSYQGFVSRPTVPTVLASWIFLLALLPLLVWVLRSETLAARVTALLALVSLVPTTTLVGQDPRYPAAYILLMFGYWALFLLACRYLPRITLGRHRLLSEAPHLIALVVLSATVLFISWRYTGFRLHFGLFDVYDLRAEARTFEAPAIVGYLATFSDNVLPVLLAYYLRRRWYLVAAGVATVILFNYGISATKQVLFLLLFAIASVFVRESVRISRRMLIILAGVLVVALVEARFAGTLIVGTLSLYRVMIIPSHLHWVHYDFFQTRELLYLTQSALKGFFASPYRENIQFLIGEYNIGDFTARANNGLFSDGYMNFGGLSVLFYPAITVAVLKLVEGSAYGLSSSVQFILVMSLGFVLLGLPLPTALLTGGIAVLVLLLSTLPRLDRRAAGAA